MGEPASLLGMIYATLPERRMAGWWIVDSEGYAQSCGYGDVSCLVGELTKASADTRSKAIELWEHETGDVAVITQREKPSALLSCKECGQQPQECSPLVIGKDIKEMHCRCGCKVRGHDVTWGAVQSRWNVVNAKE
jgi:hypothetical protein